VTCNLHTRFCNWRCVGGWKYCCYLIKQERCSDFGTLHSATIWIITTSTNKCGMLLWWTYDQWYTWVVIRYFISWYSPYQINTLYRWWCNCLWIYSAYKWKTKQTILYMSLLTSISRILFKDFKKRNYFIKNVKYFDFRCIYYTHFHE